MRLLQIDAFTSVAFRGNPAAVCLLDRERPADWMQNVAAEMNLAATAFVLPAGEEYSLRWFTSRVEIDLCGHGTLAAAHALWEEGLLRRNTVARFRTRSGLLTVFPAGDLIELDFPSTPPDQASLPDGILDAVGVPDATFAGHTRFDYFIEAPDASQVRRLQPDMRALAVLPVRGVIVTSRSDDESFDFISRFFAPGAGIDEDPVTGSAHCALAPYWATRVGKETMTGYQASPRGGVVGVQLVGARVKLRGHAVTVLRGELLC